MTGIFLNFDLCRGKGDHIRIDQFANRATMKTASTSIDISNSANQRKSIRNMTQDEIALINNSPTSDIVLGDSWFSSLNLCEHIDTHYIGVVKTNHGQYPKKFLQQKMNSWPGGSHLLLKTVLNKGRLNEKVIYALGYKYCCSKVLFFIFTAGAGHTECKPEYAYEAKWKDDNLNTLTRKISRPHVCDIYFKNSNVIDVLNQSRQFDLALEKHWITQCGFFRVVTTLFGVTVVDAWRGYMWHLGTNHRHKKIPLMDFVNLLCKDLLDNEFVNEKELVSEATYSIRPPKKNVTSVAEVTPMAAARAGGLLDGDDNNDAGQSLAFRLEEGGPPNYSQISDLTMSPSFAAERPSARGRSVAHPRHRLVKTLKKEQYVCGATSLDGMDGNELKRKRAERTMRRKCNECKNKTSMYCGTCFSRDGSVKWICSSDKHGCFENHCDRCHDAQDVRMGGVEV